MLEEQLINLISNNGFPIVICIYLLVRFEKKIVGLEQSIHAMRLEIDLSKEKE